MNASAPARWIPAAYDDGSRLASTVQLAQLAVSTAAQMPTAGRLKAARSP